MGTSFSLNIKLDKPEQVEGAIKILTSGGALATAKEAQLAISGDLGKLLGNAIRDSDEMFKNEGAKVSSRYGLKETEVMVLWWTVLSKTNKEFQKEKKINESDMVTRVIQRAVEPAFNFYGIEAESVASKAFTLTALLVFYVAYTMWWGYAIFYMFDGIGLSMKKAKVKKEV
jgi:hypothetical protein